jgi:sensor histidine kinase YesM
MIKKEYTLKEWDERELYYQQAIMGIVLPPLPDTKEVMEITSKLDQIYTEASFEYAQIKRKESMILMDLKNSETELFSTIKQQQLTAGAKITENDVKGLVKTYIANNAMQGYNTDLYTLAKFYMHRSTFMEQVIKTISEKKQSIISTTAMLKKSNFKLEREKERVVYYERELRKREVIRAEMKALQAQIKPHFIFNALSTIAYYCRNKPQHAHELLYHLSTYLRSMFNQQCDEISLQEELNTVKAYLAIESARMEGRLKIDFRLSGCFDQCYLPSFTLQPLVENAVRHGLAPLMTGGVLIIEGREETVAYYFSVSDNGVGIPEEKLKGLFDERLNRKGGIGLTNVHKRLIGLYGSGLTLNSCPGKTVVRFSIPKKECRLMNLSKPKVEVKQR